MVQGDHKDEDKLGSKLLARFLNFLYQMCNTLLECSKKAREKRALGSRGQLVSLAQGKKKMESNL